MFKYICSFLMVLNFFKWPIANHFEMFPLFSHCFFLVQPFDLDIFGTIHQDMYTTRLVWSLSESNACVRTWISKLFPWNNTLVCLYFFKSCITCFTFTNMELRTCELGFWFWTLFGVIDGKIGPEWGWWEGEHRNHLLECHGYSFRWW